MNNPDSSVGVCCSHKVVAVGFNTLRYDAERCRETAGIKPSARIKAETYFLYVEHLLQKRHGCRWFKQKRYFGFAEIRH
ncbi:hypothetical protein C5N99_07435 [Treponema medium]|nr:hypothetical protein C5N99_06715 [Treponema medium]QSH92431.1 hypothetical protein C5N99_07435 [Treponema medium]